MEEKRYFSLRIFALLGAAGLTPWPAHLNLVSDRFPSPLFPPHTSAHFCPNEKWRNVWAFLCLALLRIEARLNLILNFMSAHQKISMRRYLHLLLLLFHFGGWWPCQSWVY